MVRVVTVEVVGFAVVVFRVMVVVAAGKHMKDLVFICFDQCSQCTNKARMKCFASRLNSETGMEGGDVRFN